MAETVKKTRTTAAKPRKAAAKGSNGVSSDPVSGNHNGNGQSLKHELKFEEVARLAHSYWQQRGGQHGQHVDDWIRAEQELRGKTA